MSTQAATKNRVRKAVRAFGVTVVLAIFLSTLSQCSAPVSLRVLAGSELKDMAPIFEQMEKDIGVRLEMEYVGTLAGAEQISIGTDHDLAWFSHSRYLTLLTEQQSLIKAQEPIMLSPVVMGVKRSVADDLGWVGNANITWRDIAEASGAQKLRFAMANPASSNSGFTGLIGITAALAGTSDAFDESQVDAEGMKQFFTGQTLTSGSSGWLAEAYAHREVGLDAMINYESVLLSMNEQRLVKEPFELVYPKEGIISADYPIMLLNGSQREVYDSVVEYLKRPETQQEIMTQTLRRPAIPGVALDSRIPNAALIELPFPRSLSVINAILFAYLDEFRPPTTTVYALDVSGSMYQEPLQELKEAMHLLTGTDSSVTGQFARFRAREKVILLPFSSLPHTATSFELPAGNVADSVEIQQIRDQVDSLSADGGTAIYSTLAMAYQILADERRDDPDRFYSVVLLTDGEATRGMSEREFNDLIQREALTPIPTFSVIFGDADVESLEQIAALTNGRVFNSGGDGGLAKAFQVIRGYQ